MTVVLRLFERIPLTFILSPVFRFLQILLEKFHVAHKYIFKDLKNTFLESLIQVLMLIKDINATIYILYCIFEYEIL